MNRKDNRLISTRIAVLDKLLQKLQSGDNVAFEVDKLEDFIPFVHRFEIQAQENKKN